MGGAALALALLAFITVPRPVAPDEFADQGEAFYPEFTDPNSATTLEVIEFNQETGEPVPFKVTFKNGKWTIPSHNEYPADGKDRLAKTAAGIIQLKKDDFRSDHPSAQEAAGVIDPLDETATSLTGRGKRVTIKGENEKILADFIIGKEIEDRKDMHFIRIPGQKRIYAARAGLDISTKFADWIKTDLLEITKDDIDQITLKDYSINERSGSVNQRDVVKLTKDGALWKTKKASAGKEVDATKITNFLTALDELSIVGVRPKPTGLSASLKKISNGGMNISQADVLSLSSKGFYFTRDGNLLSNEGEIQAITNKGVQYTIRFGEIVYGSGVAVSAGSEKNTSKESGPGENRYVFISSEFIPDTFSEPKKPGNTDFMGKADSLLTNADRTQKSLSDAHNAWQSKIDAGTSLSSNLNKRFSGWYYVISAENFEKLHLKRSDILKDKKEEEKK